MDIGLIASAVGATLAPFTPFLLNISIEGGKKLAEVMAEKGGEAAWNKAQSSWHKIKDRAGDDPKVQGAALMVSAGPEDVSAQAILVRALDACLRKYPDLAQELADLLGGEPGIQQVLANQDSWVQDVAQQMRGGGEQTIQAENGSRIIGVRQIKN